jgi:hypothetical protein
MLREKCEFKNEKEKNFLKMYKYKIETSDSVTFNFYIRAILQDLADTSGRNML